jgi:four helix bundle protein
VRDPEKLKVLAEARELAFATYAATAGFPDAERFGLISQMRRAAVSVGANIVEGSHRAGNRAFVAFLHNSLGSVAELRFYIEISAHLGFGQRAELDALHARATACKKMLARLISALRRRGD